MTFYTCITCGKCFNRKSNYNYHVQNKKKPCLIKTPEIEEKITEIQENFIEFPQMLLNDDNVNNKTPIPASDDKNIKKYVCLYCDKSYSRTDSLARHTEHFCKNKKQHDDKNILIKKMSDEIEALKQIILTNKEYLQSNTNNIINNMTNSNNKTTNNIQNNSTNVQVNINGFGKEDLEKLDILDAIKVYLRSTGGNIIANMLRYINLNKNHPENHNICITDMSREIVKMHNGKKYIYKKFKNAKYDIVDKVVDNINEIVNKYKDGNYKKSDDINNKIDINKTSLKLICGEEIIDDDSNDSDDESDVSKDKVSKNLDIINKSIIDKKRRINAEHLNSKMEGLQKITFEKLKEELYNGKELVTDDN
jgi:hypothetical protein